MLAAQALDGSWDSPMDEGPPVTAAALLALHVAGRLPGEIRAECAERLLRRQRPDGSWASGPYAEHGNAPATAAVSAVLELAGYEADHPALRAAGAFLERAGGPDELRKAALHADPTAYFLAVVGRYGGPLPRPRLQPLLLPPLRRFLERRTSVEILLLLLQMRLLAVHRDRSGGPLARLGRFLSRISGRLERRACRRLLLGMRNDDGSWNADTAQTAFALLTLVAGGLEPDDREVERTVDWLLSRCRADLDGRRFVAAVPDVRTTALHLIALLESGCRPDHEAVLRGVTFLLDARADRPQPRLLNPGGPVPTSRAWPMSRGNHTMPSAFDTGLVLRALSLFREQARSRGSGDLLVRVASAVDQGIAWLSAMQDVDGGWGLHVRGLPRKPAGPYLTEPRRLPMSLRELVTTLLRQPADIGDPATADVSAVAMAGLSAAGVQPSDDPVRRCSIFLRAQQWGPGIWWGRTQPCWTSATAMVLRAFDATGVDDDARWLGRAAEWLIDKQNPDGGWGESVRAYRDPEHAGVGPSSPALTGLVLSALSRTGRVDSGAVRRGIDYLLATQHRDGSFPPADRPWTRVPPDGVRAYPGAVDPYCVEALGLFLGGLHEAPEPPSLFDRWSHELFDAARMQGDPLADAVVEELFADGDIRSVNRIFDLLRRSDDPVPDGLPPKAAAYFEESAVLPPWADPQKLVLAQEVFRRFNWAITTGLFCSALPQSYAAAGGARVLEETGRMMRTQVRRRIFETAQFIFDVSDVGAFGPRGRGIRSAQKVRLLHATVRFLLQREASWDNAIWGLPINQEDLSGTLMVFSAVIVNTLDRLNADIHRDEAEAWLHLWKVTGHILGVREDLMPADMTDAEALMDAIRGRQWAPSEHGRSLASALVVMIEENIPGRPIDGLATALVRFLAGEWCADILGLPESDWTHSLIGAAASLSTWFSPRDSEDRDADLLRLFQGLGRNFLQSLVLLERDGKRTGFRLPSTLTEPLP